ncbi:MAG TPA: SDR family oxidoreductase [Arthrobacter sp.]|nr:SDR family oxidoreductase [Arthrobacter sp.]
MATSDNVVLVTGATGYIGGRLVPRLLDAGHRVRVLVRSPEKLRDVPWAQDVEIVQGDLTDHDSTAAACESVSTLYYLVHAMGSGSGFEEREAQTAQTVARAAGQSSVGRIVYLGGLHPASGRLSEHLRSRKAVGDVLLNSPVPTVVFQAGVVIGSGSASFEMIRHLSDVLPVMPAPRWVKNRIEPIAVRDVLHYLVGALSLPGEVNRAFDIGSRDVLSYAEMMNEYALAAGLPGRKVLALPVLTPHLAGHWVNLVTPIPRKMAMPLIESLQYDAVTKDSDIDRFIEPPAEGLTTYREAVALALGRMRQGQVETRWAAASQGTPASDPLPTDPQWAGHTVYLDQRQRHCTASTAELWDVVEGIGGRNGWYSWPVAWAARGWLDKLAGGVGLRRGRRDQERLRTGESLDFWRVEDVVRGERLRLRAEMRLPGRAWLELAVDDDNGGSRYTQRAVFFPQGLTGRLYWWSVVPFHGPIFASMARNIVRTAERNSSQGQAR